MQIKSFTYVKADGSESHRVVMVTKGPSPLMQGVDLSELSFEEAKDYAAEYGSVMDEFAAKVAELNAKYDVNHRLRQFNPDGMTNVETLRV